MGSDVRVSQHADTPHPGAPGGVAGGVPGTDHHQERSESVRGHSYPDDNGDEDDGDNDDGDDDNGDDDTGFDINYVVDRPTSEPDEEVKCDDLGDIAEEGELHCVDEAKPRAPWKKTKKYKTTWKRRPLLIIIIGGLRWDYFTESFWNMTEKTVGSMKAFNQLLLVTDAVHG